MKRTLIVVLVVCSLLLSTAGAALAAGKMGGISGGIDQTQSSLEGPALAAGKVGGSTGAID